MDPVAAERYMLQLGRTRASTIFKARTRMLQVKNNYKNAHKNLSCRACQKDNETQEHVLTACPVIHNNPNNKIEKYELFSKNPDDQKLTYQKLTTIMMKLNLCSSWNKSVERPGTSGYTHVVVVVVLHNQQSADLCLILLNCAGISDQQLIILMVLRSVTHLRYVPMCFMILWLWCLL